MRRSDNNGKLIISIYDLTEEWVKYYIRAGYAVICWDKQKEGCILEGFTTLQILIEEAIAAYPGMRIHGILAACPCTDFAVSGARWWPEKDTPRPGFEPFDTSTEMHIALVQIVLHLKDLFRPKFWVIENPAGRIEQLMPELKPFRNFSFNPCDFGDPYTKRTILWGEFNNKLRYRRVFPSEGSKMHLVGSGPNRANIRSATPRGFAKAFYNANQ